MSLDRVFPKLHGFSAMMLKAERSTWLHFCRSRGYPSRRLQCFLHATLTQSRAIMKSPLCKSASGSNSSSTKSVKASLVFPGSLVSKGKRLGGSMLKPSFKGQYLSWLFYSSILISSGGMFGGGVVCKKLFLTFRRWFVASDPCSMWFGSFLDFFLSLLLATPRRMSGGAIPASR